ncbi:MAG: hypothetical protein NZL93_05885, partial [Chthoniobacterales bacterium]|nr:hypothetical protein [Chthoniobacterales bacterium]
QALQIQAFVETGTFKGDTLAAVSEIFAECHSVELSNELYQAACQRFEGCKGISLYQGNSAVRLAEIRSNLQRRNIKAVLYWLDAHWCVADHTAGKISECPLLEELSALQPLGDEEVVLVDDARLFLAPPPPPHEISQWPDFDQILKVLLPAFGSHFLLVLNDVLIIAPRKVQKDFKPFAAKLQCDILQIFHEARERNHWKKIHQEATTYAAKLKENYSSMEKIFERLEMKIARRLSNILRGGG